MQEATLWEYHRGTAEEVYIKHQEGVWKCPKCARIYREHVFESFTPSAGPICNTCCEILEWVEVETSSEKYHFKAESF